MPAFGPSLKPGELDALVAFLETRKHPLHRKEQQAETASSAMAATTEWHR
jgi:hypothetical protein